VQQQPSRQRSGSQCRPHRDSADEFAHAAPGPYSGLPATPPSAGCHDRMRPVRPRGRHGRHHDRHPGPDEPGRGPRLRPPSCRPATPATAKAAAASRRPGSSTRPGSPPLRRRSPDDAQDELDEPGAQQPPPGTPVAVTLTGTSPRPVPRVVNSRPPRSTRRSDRQDGVRLSHRGAEQGVRASTTEERACGRVTWMWFTLVQSAACRPVPLGRCAYRHDRDTQ